VTDSDELTLGRVIARQQRVIEALEATVADLEGLLVRAHGVIDAADAWPKNDDAEEAPRE
jgi:hypothetical protein